MKKDLYVIIAVGASWGICEATLGHFLHLFSLGIGWLFWFPVAFFFIDLAYRKTKNLNAVLYTAAVACALKLIDLFFPVRLDMVINPAFSILFEAITVFTVYSYLNREKGYIQISLPVCAAVSFIWRALYICYTLFLPENYMKISPLGGIMPFTKFLFLESISNTALIYAASKLYKRLPRNAFKIFFARISEFAVRHKYLKPAVSLLALAAAAFVQIITT